MRHAIALLGAISAPAGRPTGAVSARYRIAVARAYDAAGRLTSERQTLTEGSLVGTTVSPLTATIGYQYDAADRPIQITYPSGRVVTRTYTERDQLASVGCDGTAVATRLYDAGGRLTRTTSGNGLVEDRTYVPDDPRVASIASPAASLAYTYDASGRKLREADVLAAANTQAFGYDREDRLTSWSQAAGSTQSWTLTPVGDWSATVRNGVAESRTHTRVHEVTAVGAAALSYDGKGNLTRDEQGQTYTWDPENRLATARMAPTATTLGAMATYAYDALGRRLLKTVQGRTTRYWHSGAQVVEETDLAAIPTQAGVTGTEADGTLANAALAPASGGVLAGAVTRITFQPATTVVPAGFLADTGKAYGVRTNGKSYGWKVAQTGRQQARGCATLVELDTCARLQPSAGDTPGVWEIALANGTYPVVIICGDPLSTQQTNNLLVEGTSLVDPDPAATPGYTQGDFDGYALQVTVADGRLTLTSGPGAVDPKLCCIEIGAAGCTIDSAAQARLAALVQRATDATYAGLPGWGSRGYVYGSYVDEVLGYTQAVNGGAATRYFVHANHLSSPAAMTGQSANGIVPVVERYTYDATASRP